MLQLLKKAVFCPILLFLSVLPALGSTLAGDWTGNYSPCDRNQELLKKEHLTLGVRFATSDSHLAAAFARALDFWSSVLDMEWYKEDGKNCSVQLVDGDQRLFQESVAARAQFPGRPAFQGWVAFNTKAALSDIGKYLIAVHELGHLFGLKHNPSARSVMFFLYLEGPSLLDDTDLAELAAHHTLRVDGGEGVVVTVGRKLIDPLACLADSTTSSLRVSQ